MVAVGLLALSVIFTVCAPENVPPPGEKDGASALMVTVSDETALAVQPGLPAIAAKVVGAETAIGVEYGVPGAQVPVVAPTAGVPGIAGGVAVV
jgi:hypothetical protein